MRIGLAITVSSGDPVSLHPLLQSHLWLLPIPVGGMLQTSEALGFLPTLGNFVALGNSAPSLWPCFSLYSYKTQIVPALHYFTGML